MRKVGAVIRVVPFASTKGDQQNTVACRDEFGVWRDFQRQYEFLRSDQGASSASLVTMHTSIRQALLDGHLPPCKPLAPIHQPVFAPSPARRNSNIAQCHHHSTAAQRAYKRDKAVQVHAARRPLAAQLLPDGNYNGYLDQTKPPVPVLEQSIVQQGQEGGQQLAAAQQGQGNVSEEQSQHRTRHKVAPGRSPPPQPHNQASTVPPQPLVTQPEISKLPSAAHVVHSHPATWKTLFPPELTRSHASHFQASGHSVNQLQHGTNAGTLKAIQSASSWQEVYIALQQATAASSTDQLLSTTDCQVPRLVLLEQAVLQIAKLQDPWGGPSQGSQEHPSLPREYGYTSPECVTCGKQLSAWLQSASAARSLDSRATGVQGIIDAVQGSEQPAQGAATQASGLDLCISGGVERQAMRVLLALAKLGKPYICRRYFKRVVVSLLTRYPFPPGPPPHILHPLLSACSLASYPLTRPQLMKLAAAVQGQLQPPNSSNGGAGHTVRHNKRSTLGMAKTLDMVTALLRYAQVDGVLADAVLRGRWRVSEPAGNEALKHQSGDVDNDQTQQGEEQADGKQAAAVCVHAIQTGTHPGAGPAGQEELAVPINAVVVSSSLIQLVYDYPSSSGLGFQGVTVTTVARFLDRLRQLGVRPPAAWLNDCLDYVLRPQSSRRSSFIVPSTPRDMLDLLRSLVAIQHRPTRTATAAILNHLKAGLPTPLAMPDIMADVRPAGVVMVPGPAPQATPAGMPSQLLLTPGEVAAAARLLAAAGVVAGPDWCARALAGVLRDPVGVSSGNTCQLIGHIPSLLGFHDTPMTSTMHDLHAWVQDNLYALELMTQGVVGHLHVAKTSDLMMFVTGCSKLRYHPGDQFLQWHSARCQQLLSSFPDDRLVQVRAAYSSLGFRPTTLLAAGMERALQQLLLEQRTEVRQAAAAIAIATGTQTQARTRRPVGIRQKYNIRTSKVQEASSPKSTVPGLRFEAPDDPGREMPRVQTPRQVAITKLASRDQRGQRATVVHERQPRADADRQMDGGRVKAGHMDEVKRADSAGVSRGGADRLEGGIEVNGSMSAGWDQADGGIRRGQDQQNGGWRPWQYERVGQRGSVLLQMHGPRGSKISDSGGGGRHESVVFEEAAPRVASPTAVQQRTVHEAGQGSPQVGLREDGGMGEMRDALRTLN